jgi:hypothetical protein
MLTIDSRKRDVGRIFLWSLTVGIVLFLFVPITYYSNSDSYMRYAKYLLGSAQNTLIFFRTPGYPLLLILTGVFAFDSFLGLMLSQLAMAVVVPLLVYSIIATYNRRVAYYAALFSIASLVPYGFMKAVLTEQMYMSTLLLAIWVATRFFATKRFRHIYITSIVLFVLLLIRPVAQYMFVVFLLTVLIFEFRRTRKVAIHVLCAFVLVVVLIQGWASLRNRIMPEVRVHSTVTNMTNMAGRLLFYNVYLAGGHWNNEALVSGEPLDQPREFTRCSDGPASTEFINLLRVWLTPERIAATKQGLFETQVENEFFYERHAGDPSALVDQIVRSPSLTYYFFLWRALDDALGPAQADRLFFRMSLEILSRRWSLGPRYLLRNAYFFATGLPADYIPALHPNYNLKVSQPNLAGIVSYTPCVPYNGILSRDLADELKFRLGGDVNSGVRKGLYLLWSPLYLVLRPVVFVLMLAGPFVLWRTEYAPVALLSVLFVIYHLLIVCVFVMPIDRYVIETLLVELLVAAPALVGVVRVLGRLEPFLREVNADAGAGCAVNGHQ